jgi:hypothetical protein
MTEPDLLLSALDTLIATGPVAVILAVAVWWQTKGNQALVQQLNSERSDRLDDMEREIDRLRDRSDRCEQDRVELHKQIAQLIVRQREMS